MSVSSTAGVPHAYGLREPTISDAQMALTEVFGVANASAMWARILGRAMLTGAETGEAAVRRVIAAMRAEDPIARLCAQSLEIRLTSYERLAATHNLIRSAE